MVDDIKVGEYEILINHKKIKFKYPVKMIEELDDLYIILLNIPTRVELGVEELNNIVCYNSKGDFLWRIDNKLPKQIASREQIPYIAIQTQNNILKATDFFGRRFYINSLNGEIINYEVVR